ncbi:toprim domain-containing protein [Comamonas sp. NLF-1-9]|uniref:toprim domain-containing protein n=1 Tax=Comamonas sp. NLF-1-9 TaxID=2853163 RepID=UPI001C475B48|nr:toprim domain-containing protein [Comamonas sp. NLF-1-9]QXL83268.1 toprim domain-containing protein [Comamonas sp. NLF-1-9]
MTNQIMPAGAQPVNFDAALQELRAAMRVRGVEPFAALDLVPDGRLRRFRVVGDKPGSRNGWLVLHDAPLAAVFGSWKFGSTHTWSPRRATPCSPAEYAAMRERLRAAQAARERASERDQADAAERARVLLGRSALALAAHPYLLKKGIKPHGARMLRGDLVLPLRDTAGKLWSLQLISPDGEKRFLAGGRTRGCYFPIGGAPVDTLLIAEGFATGATLHEATGWPVAVAFNANNLEPVACALREKFPSVRAVVCADDDAATPGNPGLTRATAAARAVGGRVVYPNFGGVRHG